MSQILHHDEEEGSYCFKNASPQKNNLVGVAKKVAEAGRIDCEPSKDGSRRWKPYFRNSWRMVQRALLTELIEELKRLDNQGTTSTATTDKR